jgi:hypothetical protein
MTWATLPGAELVTAGLDDLEAGRITAEALLVSTAATKLRTLGVPVPDPLPDAGHELWKLLAEDDPDAAHGRYNALMRRLVSFERALACAA